MESDHVGSSSSLLSWVARYVWSQNGRRCERRCQLMIEGVVVDGGEARRIIRAQNQAALQLAQAAKQQLEPVIAARGREAENVASALAQWMGKGLRFMGRTRPEARQALVNACQWVVDHCDTPMDLGWPLEGEDGSHLIASGIEVFNYMAWDGIRDPESFKSRDFSTQAEFDRPARAVLDYLGIISERCQRRFRVRELVLDVPGEIHPPRHSRVNDGMLARLIAQDIAEQITAGEALESSMSGGRAGSNTWWRDSWKALSGLDNEVANGFRDVTRGFSMSDSPLIADPDAISRAYVSLGVGYLREVLERMPDYAEASGQEPRISMTISGNTIYGGQFAAQIANINSTIAGVAQQGSHEVADALKALEQAVLSQEGLDEEQRRDLLDNVGYLAEAAQAPLEERNRGLLRSVLSSLSIAAASGSDLRHALDNWAAVLHGILP
ncbi:hypothetical protein [Streptomyces sp. NPDC059753]|uniref:hypothetical protein n=1 Tax=Streptomyces sp. NPDC059753 TaxID=3346933 RepID=UPI00366481EE